MKLVREDGVTWLVPETAEERAATQYLSDGAAAYRAAGCPKESNEAIREAYRRRGLAETLGLVGFNPFDPVTEESMAAFDRKLQKCKMILRNP